MPGKKSFVFRFADVEVREREFSLTKGSEVLPVEPKAFRVLLLLLRNPHKLITKEELLNAVWGDAAVTENSLTRSIALLRRLLGDESRSPRFIETVATVGYRLVCPVQVCEDASTSPKPPRFRIPLPTWLIPTAAVLFACLAATLWYLRRPLPPPSITKYTKLTHDEDILAIKGTDGSRIYFDSTPWGTVEEVGVSGGEIANVAIGLPHAGVSDVSPDGSNLLVLSLDPPGLWTVGTVGGSPRLITNHPVGTWQAWSPDGKSIAYVNNHGGLDVMQSDGTNGHQLWDVTGFVTSIAWSPDNSRIRLTVDDRLWEISSSGSNPHPLLPLWHGPEGQCCGRWTRDGDFFVFLAGGNSLGPRLGAFEQIWALDERRSLFRKAARDPVQLTSGPVHWERPIPSRDGQRIFASGAAPRGELVRFDSKSKALQSFLGGISAEFLSFSGDGSQVAYVTFPDGVLWRAKWDGTERRQLTNPPLYPIVCRWSPDGTRILFTGIRDASRYDLYVVSAQGGNPELLIPAESGVGHLDGTWSPDGRKVVYSENPRAIRIFDLDRHESTKLPGSDGLYSARWSPDGRYIAALTSGDLMVKVFDMSTQEWSTVLENMGRWGFPSWSHDGKLLYVLNGIGGAKAIFRVPVSGGKPQRLIDLTGFHPTGYFGFWMGLDADDAPLLLRDNGTNDIYALTLERK